MKKLIDIDKKLLLKLKIIAAFEDTSVKGLLEDVIKTFVQKKEAERYNDMSPEEREDMGLWLLMEEAKDDEVLSEEEFMKEIGRE